MTEWCIHLANLFYLASYLGRDMLWLRALTCCGLAFGVYYFSACPKEPMVVAATWHLVFLIINAVQIVRLVHDRRRLALSIEQEAIRRGMLDGLTDQELADTLAHAVCRQSNDVRFITESTQHELTPDELALREIAISRLSRAEMTNLLARQVWDSLQEILPEDVQRSTESRA